MSDLNTIQRQKTGDSVWVETPSKPAIRTREITAADLPAASEFFGRNLGAPARNYLHILNLLTEHDTPAGFPKYGYLLEVDGAIAGGIILIYSALQGAGGKPVWCHLTAWCVEPQYRSYATLFIARALKHKDVTYLNLSARPAAVPVVEAQGFARYSDGQFFAIPALNLISGRRREGKVMSAGCIPLAPHEDYERELLQKHEEYGCICFWCVTTERAYPFVFQPRMFKGVIPGVQLLYCRDIGDLVRFAFPIGLNLALRGRLAVSIDSSGAVRGLAGKYFPGIAPRWFKGPSPRLGDLAYTLPGFFPPSG
jgi:hypothetical protein